MKKSNLHKLLALVLALVMACSMIPPVTVNAADANWTLEENTEIFWVKNDETEASFDVLIEQIQLFSSELAEKVTTTALPITYGEQSEAGEHDIILVLDSSVNVVAEGYVVTATDSSIKIAAKDADGLFYGCRYLIKELLLDGTVASVTDAPDVAERAVSLDNGRKYYSVEWIKEFIREMSRANMNALALHFSEEMGLGIESKLYPWLNGRDGELCTQAEIDDDERVLTHEEIAEIVEYANLYHIEIIPSLDSPGHMNYIVKKFNEQCATSGFTFTYDGETITVPAGTDIGNYFHYNGQTSIVKGSRNANYSRGIDISNDIAVVFTRSLIEEYATLFGDLGSTKFDIGGDELLGWGTAVVSTSTASRWKQLDHWKEYAQNRAKAEGKSNWASAVAYDGFIYYMNDLNALVRELGYTSVRMWNDDALRYTDTGWNSVVQLEDTIDIWYWTYNSSSHPNTVWTYATAGYQVHNILSDYNYYAMTTDYYSSNRTSFTKAYADQIYNEWTPFTFDSTSTTLGSGKNTAIGNPNVLGGAFGIWSDNPSLKTEDEVMADLLPMIRAHGAKSWDALANETVAYDTFDANWDKFGAAPAGTVTAPEIQYSVDVTALEAALAEYTATDASLYTTESFAAYTAAAEAGREALTSAKTQAEVDAAVDMLNQCKNALEAVSTGTVPAFISGSFKSSYVYVGKVATLNMSVIKGTEIDHFMITNDVNAEVEIVRYSVSTKKTDRDNYCIIFKATEAMVGDRTFTVYAVYADGTRSVDCLTLTIKVK